MMSRNHRGVFVATLTVFLAMVLALVAGCGTATAPGGTSSVMTSASSQPVESTMAGLPHSDPVSVDIPKIHAKSSLIPLGLNPDQSIQVPPVSTPLQAGWYTKGPAPGDLGPAVILGHVDGGGQEGIFFRLHELTQGDQVFVARKDGTTAKFVVDHVDKVSKDSFPTDQVYGNTSDAELRLITCGGTFNRATGNYVDNIIVYAKLVTS